MAKWWLIGVAAFLAVLLIASIVLALTSKEAEFAPGTPEHAVQTLWRVAESEDIKTAYTMLSQELQQKCTLKNYMDGSGVPFSIRNSRNSRVTLRDTKLVGDITFVSVRVTRFYGSGPFDSGESSYDRRYALQQEEGEWKFTEYPWPYDYCRESDSE